MSRRIDVRHVLFAVVSFLFALDSAATQEHPSSEEGLAAYYSNVFQGRRTASGERFDQKKLTSAHRTYPFGTRLEVTNLANGKTVQVRVNDRGPRQRDRIVDLSRGAADELGFVRKGTTRVRVTVLELGKDKPSPAGDIGGFPRTQEGTAAYYSNRFQGRRTASGERFDQAKLTTAHRSYPFGTRLRVTNLDNGKTVEVRVNDRGPRQRSRIVDVSRRAADELGFLRKGLAQVKLEVLEIGGR